MIDELPSGYRFAPMTIDQVHTISQWAAEEQWNPGLHDIFLAHHYDPDAFIALLHDDEMVGGGSVLSYRGQFGFMGLFIMRPDYRGQGLGGVLWRHRLRLLRARLQPDAAIGMDGVFAMEPFYAKGGFRLAYRDLRFDGVAMSGSDRGLTPITEVEFDAIAAYDRPFHPVDRGDFLRSWVLHPSFHSAAVLTEGQVRGYASLRPCRSGWRFGPVVADTPAVAEQLLVGLMGRVAGDPVQLDVPEPNEVGLTLAAGFGMVESFGTARMYHGHVPEIAVDRTYGVTSFEFG